jgi:phosphatidyl-myo-inositol dimannoside synthase
MVSDNIDGFAVDPDDIELLSKKIAFLLQNPGIARDFGEQGYEKVEKNYLDTAFGVRLRKFIEEPAVPKASWMP